jgi:multidrug efflux system membrane fusion protein
MKGKSYIFLSVIVGLIFVRFFVGNNEVKTEENSSDTVQKIPHVRTQIIKSQEFLNSTILYGVTLPIKESPIVSKFNGEILNVLVKEGERIPKGTPVIKIKDTTSVANYQSSRINHEKSKFEHSSNKKLMKKNLISKVELQRSLNNLKSAEAQYESNKEILSDVYIKSSIDGYLENFNYHSGEYIKQGQKLADVINVERIKVNINLPERYIDNVKINQNTKIIVNKKEYKSKITFISKKADMEMHTYRIEVTSNPYDNLHGGASASVILPLSTHNAYEISPYIISLKESRDEQILGIKIVENNIVKYIPIKVLKSSKNGVWIESIELGNEIELITVGQVFVNDGQKVKHTLVEKVK